MHTILLEFDLRRPSIARTLDLPAAARRRPMLEDRTSTSPIRRCATARMWPSPRRTRSISDPSSLLTSKTTHAVLQDIEDSYAPRHR
jgi:hypothetical protein